MSLPDPNNREIEPAEEQNQSVDEPLLSYLVNLSTTKLERDTRWDDAEDGDDL